MKTAVTSGGLGDIIFSIPIMQRLGIKTLHVKESYYEPGQGSLYSAVKPLLELHGFTVLPTKDYGTGFDHFDPALTYDYNMDSWRNIRGRGRDHILFSMSMYFRVFWRGWREPWLDRVPKTEGDYSLIFLSWRWRENSLVDWVKVVRSIEGRVYFIGLPEDHKLFQQQWCPVEYQPTANMLEMAQLIAGCKALYCNQSPALALAQGIGKTYHCSFKIGKTNCMIRMPWEHNLNIRQYERNDIHQPQP